jgi:hypothetical protein
MRTDPHKTTIFGVYSIDVYISVAIPGNSVDMFLPVASLLAMYAKFSVVA